MSSYIGKRGIPHASLFQTTRDLHANKRVCWSYLALTGMETPLYFRHIHSSYTNEVGGWPSHVHGWRGYFGQVEGVGWMRRWEVEEGEEEEAEEGGGGGGGGGGREESGGNGDG